MYGMLPVFVCTVYNSNYIINHVDYVEKLEKLILDLESEDVSLSIPVQETLQPSQHPAEEILPGPASISVIEETIKSEPSQHTAEEILSDPPLTSPIEETRKPQQSMITPFIGSYEFSDHVLALTHTDSYETTYYISAFTHLYQAQEQLELENVTLIENSPSALYHTAEQFI